MKQLLTLLITISITISCNKETPNSSLEDLNYQKVTLVSKIDSLNKELKNIDQEISKLDTSKKLQIVTTLPAKIREFKHFIEIQGVVKADKNIEIHAELGGTVKSILVKEGQKVSKGQLLVQLDESSVKNTLNELNTQLQLAKTSFERQERLWNQKIGSEMQYLQAKSQKENLENNITSVKNQARKMKIIAPFSGVVDVIYPKNGELTNPLLPVVRLINLDKVYVESDVTETFLPVIKVGTETKITFPSINKEVISKISQIGNYINPDNRSFKTKINISNNDQTIKPNLLADVKILDFKINGITIPSNLIQQDQKGNDYVYTVKTVNGESEIIKNLIKVSKEYNHEVYISDGLSENDTIVNAGARIIKAGDIVKIKNIPLIKKELN